jgi:hypothetical protein
VCQNTKSSTTYLLHSTDLFEYYCWQNHTTISNTGLYLSYFDLSYVFPGHNDSVKWGLTVLKSNFLSSQMDSYSCSPFSLPLHKDKWVQLNDKILLVLTKSLILAVSLWSYQDMLINKLPIIYILSLKVSTAYYLLHRDESKFILELLTFPGNVHSCPSGVACPQ